MTAPQPHTLVMSLLARDLDQTRRFYELLGFEQCGESVGWLEMRLGSATLQFYLDAPVGTPSEPSLSGTIYVHVDDIGPLHEALKELIAFEWGPELMEYDMREFAVRDPNGYLLAFADRKKGDDG